MSLSSTIRNLIRRLPSAWVPIRRITIGDSRSEPPAIGISMTAERIHGVIESAEAGDTRDLFSLYRDVILASSHIQNEFMKRKLAVIGDSLSVQPSDKTKADDVALAKRVDSELSAIPGFLKSLAALLDSSLYPVTVMEKLFRAEGGGFRIAGLSLVPYQLLNFSDGVLKVCEADARGNPLPVRHVPDPSRYIVHRGNLLTAPDNWGGPMRSILFWWLLSAMDREWWGRFLERYGSPFLLGRYSDGDDAGRLILQQAFSLATRLGGLVVSKETEVEIKAAAVSDSGAAYEKFLSICNREISKLILGQTLSSEAQQTGMNEGVSKMQEEVRQDIRRLDGKLLCETLRDQLIVQFCRINKFPGAPPTLIMGSESESKTASTISLLGSAATAGLQLSDAAIATVNERTGIEFERKASAPTIPFAVSGYAAAGAAFAPRSLDSIPANGAAALSQAFRGSLAPVAQIIRDSKSSEECEIRIRSFCSKLDARRTNALLEQALTAFAANGSLGRLM